MTSPRFQFTIRGLLWATFWLAVSAAAWRFDKRTLPPLLWWPAFAAIYICPFMAVGALFQRTLIGLCAGIAFVLTFVACIWLAMIFFLTGSK